MASSTGNLYGEVSTIGDVRDINKQIRREMRGMGSRPELTELKKRSDYLCTLTYAPSCQTKFGKRARRFREVAKEDDARTTRLANELTSSRNLGEPDYMPGREGEMAEKRSEQRYAGGGQVKYLVYESNQTLPNGEASRRRRVKRFYLPANATNVEISGPGRTRKRTGRRVNGVAVHYLARLGPANAKRGSTVYRLPERWADRMKVVEVPESADSVRLTDNPPRGPSVAVA